MWQSCHWWYVVVAKPLTHKLPVVVICDVEALPKVVKPTAVKVPNVAKLPLVVVVVAKPLTHKLPVVVICDVEALPKASMAKSSVPPHCEFGTNPPFGTVKSS